MSHKTSLTKEESQVEALLGQLQPMVNAQTRDRLMFKAGRASAGQVHLWQGASGMFAVLLVCSLTIRFTPVTLDPTILTPPLVSYTWQVQTEASSPRELDAQAYINVRHSVLTHGLGALPDTRRGRGAATDNMRYGEAFKRYMAL